MNNRKLVPPARNMCSQIKASSMAVNLWQSVMVISHCLLILYWTYCNNSSKCPEQSCSALNNFLILYIFTFQDQLQQKIVCPGIVTCLCASPNGLYVLAGIAEAIYLWEVRRFVLVSKEYNIIWPCFDMILILKNTYKIWLKIHKIFLNKCQGGATDIIIKLWLCVKVT